MTYNPLIGADLDGYSELAGLLNVPPPEPPPWWGNVDEVHGNIEKARHLRDGIGVKKWLNVMDLLDSEDAAWWREVGLKAISSK